MMKNTQNPTKEKLGEFCRAITIHSINRLLEHNLSCKANIDNAQAKFSMGNKYAKIVQGSSVTYFVRLSDGVIFAASSWKAPNLKRSYGTLDSINCFDWGNYNGVALPNSGWKMVSTAHGYFTAVKE